MLSQKIIHGAKFFLILVQQFFRKVFKKKIITVIGDSHSLLFQNPLFKIKYIGPATAFKLGYKDSTTQSRKKIIKILNGISPSSTVLLVFGEIDCRLHIYNVHRNTLLFFFWDIFLTISCVLSGELSSTT